MDGDGFEEVSKVPDMAFVLVAVMFLAILYVNMIGDRLRTISMSKRTRCEPPGLVRFGSAVMITRKAANQSIGRNFIAIFSENSLSSARWLNWARTLHVTVQAAPVTRGTWHGQHPEVQRLGFGGASAAMPMHVRVARNATSFGISSARSERSVARLREGGPLATCIVQIKYPRPISPHSNWFSDNPKRSHASHLADPQV